MANADNLWAVEWNPKTKQSNIQYLNDTIQGNLFAIKEYPQKQFVPEYLIVAVTNNPDEANQIAERIEQEFG